MLIVDGLLNHVASTFSMEFPAERGSAKANCFLLLPIDMTRTVVDNNYIEK